MTSHRGESWTDVDGAELRQLLAAGERPQEIAQQIGRSQEAITARRVRLGARLGATAR